MAGWQKFDDFFDENLIYTEVSKEYAEWSEGYNDYAIDNATYATYQDAIDVLKLFVKNEEKQLS